MFLVSFKNLKENQSLSCNKGGNSVETFNVNYIYMFIYLIDVLYFFLHKNISLIGQRPALLLEEAWHCLAETYNHP